MILTQAEVASRLAAGALSPWAAGAFREIEAKVADPAFPCTFGTVALKKGDILSGFIEDERDEVILDGLVTLMTEYAKLIEAESLVRASMMPLAVFMRPRASCATVEDYFRESWRLLELVHRRDPEPWPDRVPRDPDDSRWSFCFGGVPFFVNFKTPLHKLRRSRHLTTSYLWLVQARDGFDIVAGDTPQGRHARRLIREKLALYDPVEMYRGLAHYGAEDNREWKQYFVPEGDELPTAQCPFRP